MFGNAVIKFCIFETTCWAVSANRLAMFVP